MLEVGWSEILVIALILIIVVGPKDLPAMLRTFGQMASRVRGMANEFRSQFDEALREAELDDVRKGLSEVSKLNPTNALRDAINPIRKLGEDIKSDLKKSTDMADKPAANPTVGAVDMTPAAAEPQLPAVVAEAPVPAIVEPAGLPAVVEAISPPAIVEAKPKRRSAKAAAVVADAGVTEKPARKPRGKKADIVAETPLAAPAAEKPKRASTRKKSDKTGDA